MQTRKSALSYIHTDSLDFISKKFPHNLAPVSTMVGGCVCGGGGGWRKTTVNYNQAKMLYCGKKN